MNELERQIAKLPCPKSSSAFHERIESLFAAENRNESAEIAPETMSVRSLHWSQNMSFRVASVACLVALLIVVNGWLTGTSAVVFADVVQTAKKVKTIQYVFKRVYFGEHPTGGISVQREDGEYEFRTDVRKVAAEIADGFEKELKSTALEKDRRELQLRIDLLRAYTSDDQPILEHAVRVRAAIGGLERRESIFPMSSDSVSNAKTGLNVAFDVVRKKLLIIKHFMKKSEDAEKVPIDHIENDVITRMISIPDDAIESLGERVIEGKEVVGFRQTTQMNGGTVYNDYWVERTTRLPVVIEGRFFDEGEKKPSIYSEYRDFVFDEPLDESLFSTVAPEGYTTKDVAAVFLSAPSESEDSNE